MPNYTPAEDTAYVDDNMSHVSVAELNLEAAINTRGRGLVVRPFKVDGVETAIVCIVQSAEVTEIEGEPEGPDGEVQIRARLVPLFILAVPDQKWVIEPLPMDGERDLISTLVDRDANISSETGHS